MQHISALCVGLHVSVYRVSLYDYEILNSPCRIANCVDLFTLLANSGCVVTQVTLTLSCPYIGVILTFLEE